MYKAEQGRLLALRGVSLVQVVTETIHSLKLDSLIGLMAKVYSVDEGLLRKRIFQKRERCNS